MDPYSTLEVPHDATIEVIKKAYWKLAKKWHPDKNGGSLDAAEMFRKVKAAYDCLVDPIKRAAADAQRKYQEQAEAAKKAKVEADRQARAHAYAQPPQPGRSGISPLAVMFAFIAFVFIIVALFGSNHGGSNSTSA
ncbi:MAG TPA: J domain-containing protein [Flavobacteriales bacterium]|nr:J domain-containing protein [Flavobacteriales bacterium]